MIHGVQKMVLTHASVREALENYLAGHMSVPVTLKTWTTTRDTYGDALSIDVEFEQAPAG